MVQKIITLCDVHGNMEPAVSVDAETYLVTFDDGVGYSLDLCSECFDTYAKPFYDLVMVCGRQREKPRKVKIKKAERTQPPKSGHGVAATFRCNQCDYGTEYLQSFRFHCFRVHDMTEQQYAEAAGAAAGDQLCPQCGIGFKTERGVNMHVIRKHKADTLNEGNNGGRRLERVAS